MKPEYIILKSADSERLSDLVSTYLSIGWELVGGVQVLHWLTTDERDGSLIDHWWHAQAMIRTTKD
jgi:hypothetical protein